jgi:hypothetical protein
MNEASSSARLSIGPARLARHGRPRHSGDIGDLAERMATGATGGRPKQLMIQVRRVQMPRRAWSDKRERQYDHVKEGLLERGEDEYTAEEIAARTVNKERARAGEAEESSRTWTEDISSGRRGGVRSHRGSGGRTRDQPLQRGRREEHQGPVEDDQGRARAGRRPVADDGHDQAGSIGEAQRQEGPRQRQKKRSRTCPPGPAPRSASRAQPSPSASAPAAPRPGRAKSSTRRRSGAIYRVARRWAGPSSPERPAVQSTVRLSGLQPPPSLTWSRHPDAGGGHGPPARLPCAATRPPDTGRR